MLWNLFYIHGILTINNFFCRLIKDLFIILLVMEECENNLLKDGLCFFCSLELIITEIYDIYSDDIFRNVYPVIRWLLFVIKIEVG